MSFITHIKTRAIELTDIEREHIEEKLAPLEKELHGEEAYTCDVEIEQSKHHLSGDVIRAEVKLTVKGNVFYAEATRDTLMNALDEVRADVQRMVRTHHAKMHTLMRRSARAVRRFFGKE